jgi:SAM-dependent methyltransferase
VAGSRSEAELREHFEIERELALRLRRAPSKAERRRLYGEVYAERTRRISHHPLVRRAADERVRARAVAPQVALLKSFLTPSMVFSEVGAGDGAVARAIAPSVRRSIALDVSDALAVPPDPSVNFEFWVFDGFDIRLSREVDLMYSNDVVEHLHPDDLLDHLRAVHGALAPGGRYLCVTPNRLSGPHDISRHFVSTPQGFHLREYTSSELAAAMRAAGFSRVSVLLTYGGRRLTPLLPAAAVRPVENVIERLPASLRRRCARPLAAVKVVGHA